MEAMGRIDPLARFLFSKSRRCSHEQATKYHGTVFEDKITFRSIIDPEKSKLKASRQDVYHSMYRKVFL